MKALKDFSFIDFRFPVGLGFFLMMGAGTASLSGSASLSEDLAFYAYWALMAGALMQILRLRFRIPMIPMIPRISIREIVLIWLTLVLGVRVLIGLVGLNATRINEDLLILFLYF